MNNKKIKFLIYEFCLPYLLTDIKYPVGGSTVETMALIRGLIFNGHEVGVLSWKGAKDFVNRKNEFDIIEAFERKRGIRKIRWIYHRYPALIKCVKRYSPDYILKKTAGMENGIVAFVAKKLNIPFIYRAANDMEVDERLNQRLSFYERKLYQYGLKNAEYIIAQNDYQHNKLKKKYPNKKIFKIYNAFYPLEVAKDERKRKYIAWVGIFSQQKNIDVLLNIANKLPKTNFKIAGTVPPYGTDEKTKLALAALSKLRNVQFVNYLNRSKIMDFLANSWALLNTSHYEGFSNTFLEAFAAGTPVISLNSDPDGILKKYKLGLVVNLQAVAQVIKKLPNDYNYEACKIRMKNYLDSFHNYRTVSEKLVEILKRK